jgi:hypothetical protein
MFITELDPQDTNHDPDRLYGSAMKLLAQYGGSDSPAAKYSG